jgi:hypothetical protein
MVTVYAAWLAIDGRYLDLAWPALAAPALPLMLETLLAHRLWTSLAAEARCVHGTGRDRDRHRLQRGRSQRDALRVCALLTIIAACSAAREAVRTER